jgi:Pyridoxamine 5'-phosphate oxidase
MASWREIEAEAPELAERARGFLDARKHKTLATLRKDGSPRISGTEANVVDGELMWGSMWRSVKALDLLRDPRFALHTGSDDPPGWSGDAKVSGRAEEIDDDDRKRALVEAQGNTGEGEAGPGRFHLFRADVDEVVVTRLNDARDKLVIELWRPGEGVKTFER